MKIRSEIEYKKKLMDYRFEIYNNGGKVEDFYEHKCVVPIINSIGATYNTGGTQYPR